MATGPGIHRHLDSRGKWTTDKDAPHIHSETVYPADSLTADDVSKLLALVGGGSGGTPGPTPPPPDTTPPVISAISSGSPTSTTAVITWTTNEGASSQVEYGLTTSYGSSTTLAPALTTSHTVTVAGLAAGTLYHYRVKSADLVTNSTTSGDQTFTTASAATVPGIPTGLTATPGDTIVNLAWNAPASNGGSSITLYRVYRGGVSIGTTASRTYTDTGRTNGVSYTYTVAAINAVGEGSQSSSASATPVSGPDITAPVISSIVISNVTTTSATVSCTTNEAATVIVEYGSTTAYGSQTSATSSGTTHSRNLTGLTPGVTYHVRVRATDTAGNLALSSDRTFGGAMANAAPGELQALINAAASGSTLTVPQKIYHETATIGSGKTNLVLDLNGSHITGDNTRKQWLIVAANGVTVKNGTMRDAASASFPGEFQLNSLAGSAVNNLTLDNLHLTGGAARNFGMDGPCTGLTVTNCEIDNARVLGIGFGLVSTVLIDGNHIHHNNPNDLGDPGNEAGGLKCGNHGTSIVITNNESDHNHGVGIWIDIYGAGIRIANNRVHHNQNAGIAFEVSGYANDTGAFGTISYIEDNSVWENAWLGTDWTFAGILISSAANVEVRRNTVAWNRNQFSVFEQHRLMPPGNTVNFDVKSVNTNNNVFVLGTRTLAGGEYPFLQVWSRDDSGPIFTDANVGSLNKHWSYRPDGEYGTLGWNGSGIYTMSTWNATPVGGTNSSLITSGARDTLLVAAGIPTTPEVHP